MRRLLVALAFALLAAPAAAQEFSVNFNTDDPSLNFGFAGKASPVIKSGRTLTWLGTGGWNGTGGVRVTINACTPGTNCPADNPEQDFGNQGNVGWDTPPLGGTYTQGVSKRYVRWREKLISTQSRIGNKKVLFGVDDGRVIIKQDKPMDINIGCHPSSEGNNYYGVFVADTDPTNAYQTAVEHGLLSSFTTLAGGGTNASNYSIIVAGVNVSYNCAPYMLLPNSSAVGDVKPQNNAALTQSGWAHLQFEFTSGTACNASIKGWANNNTYASPTVQAINVCVAGSEADSAIPVDGWEDSLAFGGFVGVGQGQEALSYVVDDFAVSASFDANFYELAGGGGAVPSLDSIAPNSGPTSGGTGVTLTGTDFASGATVRFSGESCTSVNVVSSTTITCQTPPHSAGLKDVVVVNPDTESDTLASGFTYTDTVKVRTRLFTIKAGADLMFWLAACAAAGAVCQRLRVGVRR